MKFSVSSGPKYVVAQTNRINYRYKLDIKHNVPKNGIHAHLLYHSVIETVLKYNIGLKDISLDYQLLYHD